MKLKGLTKLALSGVALAAVAATLGTSTYAWYVSNSKAEVSNISGQSNSQAAGSLLLNQLAADPDNGKVIEYSAWTNKLAFSTLAFQSDSSFRLDPVTKDKTGYIPSGDGVTATGWHDAALKPVTNDTTSRPYGYFMFGIETTDDAKRTVNMTFGIANNTVTRPTQTAYDEAGLPTNPDSEADPKAKVQVGASFTEDFIQALKFDYHVDELTASSAIKSYDQYLTEVTASYAANSFLNKDLNDAYASPEHYASDGNAHTYYKALSDDNRVETVTQGVTTYGEIKGGEQDGSQALSQGTTQFTIADSTKKYVLVVRYWLDGADPQCFDSCVGQSFLLNMKLETVATVNQG